MEFLIPSFLAGVLTVIAPCTIALLPVILGGTLGTQNIRRPLAITLSLGISVFVFTLLLKASTLLIAIDDSVWKTISGAILTLLGLLTIFPNIWNRIAFSLKLYKSESLLAKSADKEGVKGGILLGGALGPVFSSCSPTYAFLIATVLPQNLSAGLSNMAAYSIGLMIPFLIIGIGGQRVTRRLKWAVNPNGWFKKLLGLLLIIVGIAIFTGYDKTLEVKILDSGYLGPIEIENRLMENFKK